MGKNIPLAVWALNILSKTTNFKCQSSNVKLKPPHLYLLPTGERGGVRGILKFGIALKCRKIFSAEQRKEFDEDLY
jgi:hypothetical protein